MADLVKKVIALSCLVGSAAALYNVYSDVGPLEAQAASLACGAKGCLQLLSRQRTPLSQDFVFQIQKNSANRAHVECQRQFYLLGDYSCALQP